MQKLHLFQYILTSIVDGRETILNDFKAAGVIKAVKNARNGVLLP